MVFESLVVDLMNRYLGEYIENLDASQLKLGIWGGNAVLENLHVKEDALKDLDLPVQLKSGHVGKLTLKIPWKNLYKEAVEATLDGLYLLVVPNSSVKYDAEKEQKKEQENKQAQLNAIEEQQLKKIKGKEEKQDGFVEKLATQIIKNLQIHVRNIHVRYEDKVTIKDHPFALGVTLHNLSFQTTNEDWIPCLLDESIKIIYKMVDLECLSVYWNPSPEKFVSDASRAEQLHIFQSTIASKSAVPPQFSYIIKPINLQTRLRLNPHPHSDLSKPKIMLGLELEEIGLRLLHDQYHGVMLLVESMDRMVLNSPFRKFRPEVSIGAGAKAWWIYAFNSVLETGVVRRAESWSWLHIKKHREKLRKYKAKYKEKLQLKKASQALTNELIAMENNLDVINITMVRQTAEVELVRACKKIRSKLSIHQPEKQSESSGGWFSGWFSKKEKAPEGKTASAEATAKEKTGLDSVMSSEEKENLYSAIDYSEGELIDDSSFPNTYVGAQVNFSLKKVSVELRNNSISEADLLSLRLLNVSSIIEQRPTMQGLVIAAHMSTFEVDGLVQNNIVPSIITSQAESGDMEHLLTVLVEVKPLDETCDQRIIVDSQPLQIVYDALTINSLLEFFKPPEDVQLQQLRSVAASAYDDIKEQTATGLQHVMETRTVMEIGIRLSSSCVVIPRDGVFQGETDVMVLDLGQLSLESNNQGKTPMIRKSRMSQFAWTQEIKEDETLDLEEMRSKAYDKFEISLKKIQLLLARKGEDWRTARHLDTSSLHVLEPLNVQVLLQKCMIMNDAALPKIKISGEIPLLSLKMSESKLRDALALVQSIPLPAADLQQQQSEIMVMDSWKKMAENDIKVLSSSFAPDLAGSRMSIDSGEEEFFTAESDIGSDSDDLKQVSKVLANDQTVEKQMTDLELTFRINEMTLLITEDLNGTESQDLLLLRIGTIATNLKIRTWDMIIGLYLHSISTRMLQYTDPQGAPLDIIDSVAPPNAENLLQVDFVQVKPQSPEFEAMHNKIKQKIVVRFGTLRLALHAQAVKKLIDYGQTLTDLQPPPSELPAIEATEPLSGASKVSDAKSSDLAGNTKTVALPATGAVTQPSSDVTELLLDAQLESIDVSVFDASKYIMALQVQGVQACVKMTTEAMTLKTTLRDIVVIDSSDRTLYKKIVSSIGDDILDLELTNYNGATQGAEAFANMENVDTRIKLKLGCVRVVFLNKFVQSVIEYASNFADAKQVAIDAGAAAQEKAAARAQQLAESNPRVALDVTLSAPKVVVPMHSMSLDVIVADLGTLYVKNAFAVAGTGPSGPAVKDEMMVALRDVRVTRCRLTEDKQQTDESIMLEPVTLVVEIVRNLSASWYHDIADVAIKGSMPTISLVLSQADITSVMKLLDQNLNEGAPSPKEGQAVAAQQAEAQSAPVAEAPATVAAKTKAKQSSGSVWDTLKVNFDMRGIEIGLFSDVQHKMALAKFQLLRVLASVRMRSDESVDVDFALGELSLFDKRTSHQDGFTRLIGPRQEEEEKSLISAQVFQKADGSLDVNALVSSLSIILSAEFIMKVVNFFLEAIKPDVEEVPSLTETAVDEQAVVPVSAQVESVAQPATKEVKTSAEDTENGRSKAINVKFKLEEPEIVLVTDVRSLDSEAIVLGMKLNMDFVITPDGKKQMLSASLFDLRLDGCLFRHVTQRTNRSAHTHKAILAPSEVKLAGLITDDVQDFDVSISDIRLKASPILINTLSEIAERFTSAAEEETEKEKEKKKMSKTPAKLWMTQKIDEMNFWFMNDGNNQSSCVDKPADTDACEEATTSEVVAKQELAKISLPLLDIQLETGSGHHTVPLLITECTLKGNVSNWSSGEMRGEFELTLGTAYFNDHLSVWEPLIEPVEVKAGELDSTYEPWKVCATIQQSKPTEEDSYNAELPALMSVSVESKNLLQATISSAAMKVLNGLGTAFRDAALTTKLRSQKDSTIQASSILEVQQSGAAIVVKNYLGCDILVDVGEALRVVSDIGKTGMGYKMKHRDLLLLDYAQTGEQDLWTVLHNQESMLRGRGAHITVSSEASKTPLLISIAHTGAFLYEMKTDGERSIKFGAVVDSIAGIRKVALRSTVIIRNHLSAQVEIFNKNSQTKFGIAEPEKNFAIPPQFVDDQMVLIRPLLDNNECDRQEVSWKAATDDPDFHSETFVRCAPSNNQSEPVFINVEVDKEEMEAGTDGTDTVSGQIIHLWPCAALRNFLPFPIQYSVSGIAHEGRKKTLEQGQTVQVTDAEIHKSNIKVTVPSYRETDWASMFPVAPSVNELSVCTFQDVKDEKSTITLANQTNYCGGMMRITIFSPYWLVNKTGLTLSYKGSDEAAEKAVQHLTESQEAMLFAYTSKAFLSTNKFQLRVCNSSFSDSFSIDAVGSSGTIVCKTKSFDYIIGTQIALTSFSLTKVVTFTPYYGFHNNSNLDIEICESGAAATSWLKVDAGEKITFWPEGKENCLLARLKGHESSVSTKFRFNKLDSGFLLRVGNDSLFVEVSVTEASVDVSVSSYYVGSTAVLIVNDAAGMSIECGQNKQNDMYKIEYGETRHVLWDKPTGQREMLWKSSFGKQDTIDVFREQTGDFSIPDNTKKAPQFIKAIREKISSGDCDKVYYVVFVDGLQRILLFTTDERRAKEAETALRFERPSFQLNLALHGVACSLADSKAQREVAFLALSSSGLMWEEKPKKRWKPLAIKYSQLLETAYQKRQSRSNAQDTLALEKYVFDLENMKVIKPHECPLQRSFAPGLWVQFCSTATQVSVHAKINRLQVDSQLPGATFPVILHPVPLPRSIAVNSTPKPFVEVSLIQRNSVHHAFNHIKNFQVLVQEFSVKLDMGLISALLPIFVSEENKVTPEQEVKYFKEDMTLAIEDSEKDEDTAGGTIVFYDNLHLSPIKIHVSFSMQNQTKDSKDGNGSGAVGVVTLPFSALSVVLQSVGVTLSDVDDVVFKLAYFERKFQFLSSAQLQRNVTVHYAGQAIKQLYVLVLGLDVIGNPYGLVMGIAEGVTSLFYEPYQGMIQGPGEFFEGLGLGALSLFGHTVGGAAGAVSKVTGALGKGIATMTMDDDYQKKRLEAKNKQPADVTEGLARGGRGLVMGVFSGVTGIVTKPVEGAKKEGAAGFFKGVGKGLIGVVTRPVSGVVDLASSTFEGIQKVADMSEEVHRMRPARWINPSTGILEPYSLRRAQGAAILQDVDRGNHAINNQYLDHVPLKPDRKSVLLLTNKMIMCAHTGDILGQWKSDWKCLYAELTDEPQIHGKELKVFLKDPTMLTRQQSMDRDAMNAQDFNPLDRLAALAAKTSSENLTRAAPTPIGALGRFFSKRSLFTRSATVSGPTVQYSDSKTQLRMQKSEDYSAETQSKTKSLFGGKTTQHTATFHEVKHAEYILKKLLVQWKRVKKGPDTSAVSSRSSSTSH